MTNVTLQALQKIWKGTVEKMSFKMTARKLAETV